MLRSKNKQCEVCSVAMRGFSLIEVMVVLAILAILAAIEYPSYQEAVRKAKRAEGRAALLEVMQQQERHYSQNGAYVAFSALASNGFKWFSAESPGQSAYEISAAVCSNGSLQTCVVLSAAPGTDKVNSEYIDEACGVLTLASTGARTASGTGTHCW